MPISLSLRPELVLFEPTRPLAIDASGIASLGAADTSLSAGPLHGALKRALTAMAELEGGAIANPDENRQVGHYWLRDPSLAPSSDVSDAIEAMQRQVSSFAADLRAGRISPPKAARFTEVVLIGIGGSALGPQLVVDALRRHDDPIGLSFIDNTDPDGARATLARLGAKLNETLVVVVSKSGGTKETRNGMLEAKAALEAQGLSIGPQAVAVTGEGSKLDQFAEQHGFIARFPMWSWVGGRTSVTSAVGLLPAALVGIDTGEFLRGAAAMDCWSRTEEPGRNPAALLAATWFTEGNGHGERDMVILPYSDRLPLMSRYLQQLVMESIGKKHDLDGKVVHQGIAVYGNKGSTDQHAYVQQLLDGPDNFFATFIEVPSDYRGVEVDPGITTADYLFGFLHGTRKALADRDHGSLLITLPRLSAASVGALVALFERAVGLYATLVNVNAYHQPAVESGKRAATAMLAILGQVSSVLPSQVSPFTADSIATSIGHEVEPTLRALLHLRVQGVVELEDAARFSFRLARPA